MSDRSNAQIIKDALYMAGAFQNYIPEYQADAIDEACHRVVAALKAEGRLTPEDER